MSSINVYRPRSRAAAIREALDLGRMTPWKRRYCAGMFVLAVWSLALGGHWILAVCAAWWLGVVLLYPSRPR